MSDQPTRRALKFALTAFPDRFNLPGRPSGASAPTLDSHKQTQFLLGDDLALFERAMNLQLAIVSANKKARSPEAAAVMTHWSRTFSHLSGSCSLMSSGSYVSCAPLLRGTLDCIAVERSLIAEGFVEYEEWLENAVSQAKEHQALAFDLGRYRAGSVLANDAPLGALYRLLTDLSMPHFGSTALQVAPDSNLQKLSMAFADTAFHLGWAELISGWQLLLADAQLQTVVQQDGLAIGAEHLASVAQLHADIASLLSGRRRCRFEEVDDRFLFHNFRRTASGQPRKVLL